MIYRYTERVDSKRQDRNKIKMKVKCMIPVSPCCHTFENVATRLKDAGAHLNLAATRLGYKLLFQSPK